MNVGATEQGNVKPFLRWAGGKRWLSPILRELTKGLDFHQYIEPFLGGGAAFFALGHPAPARLSDANAELVETWATVKEQPTEVAARLAHYSNDSLHYYEARRAKPRTAVTRAARFIFLNHTSFNGIYRVNLEGAYNVPFGHRRRIALPSKQDLVGVAQALVGADVSATDFQSSLDGAGRGDLCFLDPPYTVAHNNNGFIKYNQKLFSIEDQGRLAESIKNLSDRGAHYIMTNAAHDSLHEMFSPLGNSMVVFRRNSVGGRAAARGNAAERIYTNLALPKGHVE